MKKIKHNIIQDVWDMVNIKDVFELLYPNVPLKKSGSYWKCKCVFHNDNNPSLFIEPQFNKVHCFGCNTDLTLFKFVEQSRNCSFHDAVVWLIENFCPGISKLSMYIELTSEEEEQQKRYETQLAYMSIIHDFYRTCYEADTKDAAYCRSYTEYSKQNAQGRWDAEFCKLFGFGFAPDGGKALLKFAKKKGLDLQVLSDIGMIKQKVNKDGKPLNDYYDAFRNRLMIPWKNRWGKVVAYSARTLDNSDVKYLNNICSKRNLIFKKAMMPFGLDVALSAAMKSKRIYLVEGAPDAIRLNSLGIYNVAASIGGHWTEEMLSQFKSVGSVTFIPDADANTDNVDGVEVKRGEHFVLQSAERALRMGYSVAVRPIPTDGEHKEDADSYIKSLDVWNTMEDKDFILWYTEILYDKKASHEQQIRMLNRICDFLMCINDTGLREAYLTTLKKKYSTATLWKNAMRKAEERSKDALRNKDMEESERDLSSYPFHISDGCFVSYGSNNTLEKWTNCIIDSLYHIGDINAPTRILRLTNGSYSRIVEINQSDISNYSRFQSKLEGYGNFRIKCGGTKYEAVRDMICDFAESTYRVKTMGFNPMGDSGFYAQANGVQYEGKWIAVDEFGMVRLGDRCYFIPAYSTIYKDIPMAYANMRRFTHNPERNVTMNEYFSLVEKAFGTNGIVGLTYCMATMFKDIVVSETRFFPILFVFGRKSTGKTEFSISLSRLFQSEEEISNISNTTIYSIAEKMEGLSNGLVTFDEYQEDTDSEKRDLIKGIHDASGRTARSEITSERSKTSVPCGVLITGNAMPVQDSTLLSRMLYLEAHRHTRVQKEIDVFTKLKYLRDKGVTSITLEMQKYRKAFAQNFRASWRKACREMKLQDEECDIDQRQIECWALLYATAYCLETIGVKMPFSRKRVFEAATMGMAQQYTVTKETQDTGEFWNAMCDAAQDGSIILSHDFKLVKVIKKFDVIKDKEHFVLTKEDIPGRVLMLHSQRCIKKILDSTGMRVSPLLMRKNLCDNPEYLGTGSQCTSFIEVDQNGVPKKRIVTVGGKQVERGFYRTNKPLLFDYEYLIRTYNIDLEVYRDIDEYTKSNLEEVSLE